MWWMLDGFGIWVILGVLYGGAVVWCWIRDIRDNRIYKARQAEREEIRRIQNGTHPTLRLMLLLGRAREELRHLREEDRIALEDLRRWQQNSEPKPKVDWKEEGF